MFIQNNYSCSKIKDEDCERVQCRQSPNEQFPKKILEQISQVKEPQWDATLESAFIKRHKREDSFYLRVKLSDKRTEKGMLPLLFSVLFCVVREPFYLGSFGNDLYCIYV